MFAPLATLRIVHGLWRLFRDPNRLDEVYDLAGALETPALLEEMATALAQDPHGARALARRPRLGVVDVDALAALPEGTLGRSFADFLRRNGLDPAPLTDQADKEGEYLVAHLYETHDLWHVITGIDTDVAGELSLQAFYLAQIPGNLGAVLIAIGLLNAVFFNQADLRPRVDAVSRGWQLGLRSAPLFGRDWARQWDRPLVEIRHELGFTTSAPARGAWLAATA
jgi:ubiquinone biosynthesis protein Coq4